MSIVGIDFGNSNCYVAVARQGGLEVATNDYSLRATPSCVAFGPNSRIMGVAAKQQQVTNYKNTICGFKQLIGRLHRDKIAQLELKDFPIRTTETKDGSIGIHVDYLGSEQTFTPNQIFSMMLVKLREIGEAYLSTPVVDCVIAIPCFWTDIQRRAVLDAVRISGLNAVRLMNETTAVALSYGFYKADLPEAETDKPLQVVFVDVGHLSTQASICQFHKGKLKMVGTSFDPYLGGRDLDRAIRERLIDDFKSKFNVDARKNPRAFIRLGLLGLKHDSIVILTAAKCHGPRLQTEAEKLKKQMSSNSTAIPVNIECFMDDKDVRSAMKREEFEALPEIASWKERFERVLTRLLADTKMTPAHVDSVEIVGGGTRVPFVKDMIHRIFGKEPCTTLNADEAVSRGAVLQCAILSPKFKVKDFGITDVQPFSIQLHWSSEKGETDSTEVFPENHPFPFSKLLTFYRREPFTLTAAYTYPNHIPHSFTQIGQYSIGGVVPTSKGESQKVKVKARLNPNGLLTLASATLYEAGAKEEEEPMEDEDQPAVPQEQQNGDEKPAEENNMDNGDGTQNGMEVDGKSKKKKEKEDKKPRLKAIDLPIRAELYGDLSEKQVQQLVETEIRLHNQDVAERDKLNAKNELEEYVYDARDKLTEQLKDYITEEDSSKFKAMLDDVENWLYGDGEDQPKKAYNERMTQLKQWGDPVVERYAEAQNRPRTFDGLAHAIQMAEKAYNAYVEKEPSLDHIPEEDMQKVLDAAEEKRKWFDKQANAQQRRPLTEPPVVFCREIEEQRRALESIVNPIINRPKPKPKVEEPKADPKMEQPTTDETQDPQSPEPAKPDPTMEVD